MLDTGDARKFPQALGIEGLDLPYLTAIKEDRDDRRLVQLNLLAKLVSLIRQILFNLTIRVAPKYFKLIFSSNCWPFMIIFALTFSCCWS